MQSKRSWMVTWNNPDATWDELVRKFEPTFMTGQLERGESGTPHWQFFVFLRGKKTLGAMKKLLPLAHLEPAKSLAASIKYCRKTDTRVDGPFTHGDEPTGGSGSDQAENWELWYKAAAEGRFHEIPPKIQIQYMSNLEKISRKFLVRKDQDDVRGIWIYGDSGVGKSHLARQTIGSKGYYPKLPNKWWDAYQAEDVVILEDVYSETFKYLPNHLKIWTDKWSFIGESKGGACAPSNRWFVVTSNYSLDYLTSGLDRELQKALSRRFRQFRMESRDLLMDIQTQTEVDILSFGERFK